MEKNIIVDSNLSLEEAIKQNPDNTCPKNIIDRQILLDVFYYSFDDALHKGQIIVDNELVQDVKELFEFIKNTKFPIASVIPIADPKFHWDDELSMQANNSSGFNYRNISRTNKLSNHALGRAVDLNTLLNPYIKAGFVQPKGAVYDPSKKGTFTCESKIVKFLKQRGWIWGGDWEDRIDYQHFEKP